MNSEVSRKVFEQLVKLIDARAQYICDSMRLQDGETSAVELQRRDEITEQVFIDLEAIQFIENNS